jgi:hypothetical protein
MEDVLDVYQRPYDPKRPLICFDESGKELQATPRGQLPLTPQQGIRQDYEYQRHGSCNVFLAVEPLRGWRKLQVTAHHTGYELAEFLRQLVEEDRPDAEALVLVADNLNTHANACLYQRFPPAQARRIATKLEWHYTPEHGSWLNMAECELSVLAQQCLDQRFADQATLERAAGAWVRQRNAAQVTIDWQFRTEDARIKLKRLYQL